MCVKRTSQRGVLTVAKRMTDAFYFLGPPDILAELEAQVATCTGTIGEAGISFKGNIEAALSVASIPFLMASRAATSHRFHSLLTAGRIRARGHDPKTSAEKEEIERQVIAKANERFEAESATADGSKFLREDTLHRLEDALKLPDFERAAEELLSETLVMIWGAFEVFVSDVVRGKLNLDPSMAMKLVTSDPVRKHFRKDVSIETLAGLGFDLNRAMGDVLLSDQQLENLPRMREVLSALLPGAERLHEAMAGRSLWLLWQRRHLIVHRRGIVDAQFIANTGETAALGSRIAIGSEDVDDAALTVTKAATAVLRTI
jgi:hypothetical protein